MKLALPVTLFVGGLSLLITALAAFTFYLEWIGQPTLQAISQPPLNVATSVAAATDLASLKTACLSLAQSHDANTSFLRAQQEWSKNSLSGIASFALVWGLISGVTFLYVHFLLRRLARESKANGL